MKDYRRCENTATPTSIVGRPCALTRWVTCSASSENLAERCQVYRSRATPPKQPPRARSETGSIFLAVFSFLLTSTGTLWSARVTLVVFHLFIFFKFKRIVIGGGDGRFLLLFRSSTLIFYSPFHIKRKMHKIFNLPYLYLTIYIICKIHIIDINVFIHHFIKNLSLKIYKCTCR